MEDYQDYPKLDMPNGPKPHQEIRLLRWLLVASLIVMIGGFCSLGISLNRQQQEISRLNKRLDYLNNDVQMAVNSGMGQLETMLQEEASPLAAYDVYIADTLNEAKMVECRFAATPKIDEANLNVSFILTSNADSSFWQEVAATRIGDSTTYQSDKVALPLLEDLSIQVILTDESGRTTYLLPEDYYLLEQLTLGFDVSPGVTWQQKQDGKVKLSGTCDFFFYDKGGNQQNWQITGNMTLERNGEVLAEKPLVPGDSMDTYSRHYHADWNDTEIVAEPGEQLDLYCTALDENGFQYRQRVVSYTVGSDDGFGMAEQAVFEEMTVTLVQ